MYLDVTSTYLQSSSIRGFPRIIKASNYLSKILWVLIVLIFTGIAVWQVSEVVRGYLKYEVQLEYHSTSDPTAAFPSVTVCNQQPFAADPESSGGSRGYFEFVGQVNSLEASLHNVSLGQLRNIAAFYQNSRVTQIDAIAHMSGSLIRDCKFELVTDNHVYWQPCSEKNFQKFPHPRYFRCYTIKYEADAAKRTHLRSVRLVTYLDNFNYPFFSRDLLDNDPDAVRQGLRLSVHPSGSLPQLDANFIDVPPGSSATLQVATVRRRLRPQPYGHCLPRRHERIVASSPLEDSLSYAYTQYACQRMCLQQLLIRQCQCIDPLLPVPPDVGIDDGTSDIDTARAATSALPRTRRSVEAGAALDAGMIRLVPYCRKWPGNSTKVKAAATALQERIKCAEGLSDQAAQLKSCMVGAKNLSCYQPCNFTEHSVSTSYAGWPQEAFHLAVYDKYIRYTASKKYFKEYEHILQLVNASQREAVYRALAANKLLKDNFVEVTVMKSSWNVTEISQVPSFPISRLLGAIGGTMNLWSGITIIAVVEFLELLAILAGTFLRNNCTGRVAHSSQSAGTASRDSNEMEEPAEEVGKATDSYGSLLSWPGK